jgi:hypothetical protein
MNLASEEPVRSSSGYPVFVPTPTGGERRFGRYTAILGGSKRPWFDRDCLETDMKRTRALAVLAASASALLGGCIGYYAGGPLSSEDLYTYESTPDYPQTVTLVDHTTGESLWSVDVPIGQQLVVRFLENKNKGDAARPDVMQWRLMPMGQHHGTLDNAMPVPPYTHRRLDTFNRKRSVASGTP